MLTNLSIKNYILINELELPFGDGFTVITGETGAGKSILIGALSLILGKRADTDVLLHGDRKCVIEGTFAISGYDLQDFFNENELDYDEQAVLRREISTSGKSRAFINDTPVNLPVLKNLGERLVDIHSQHETLMLNESGFQLGLVDSYAKNSGLLEAYRKAYRLYHDLHARLERMKEAESGMRAEEDYLRFQFEELEAARLSENEIEELEEELRVLTNAEEIKGKLFNATQLISLSEDNALDKLREAMAQVSKVSSFHREIEEYRERLDSLVIDLRDIGTGLERLESSVSVDTAQLEALNQRLDLLNGLLQKHRAANIHELIGMRDMMGQKLRDLSSLEEDIAGLEHETEHARKELVSADESLSHSRQAILSGIEDEITATLRQLGMQDAILQVRLDHTGDFTLQGSDRVEFLFSANRGILPAPVSRIASGGELSRLMLAMKSMITKKSLLPTIILDEIDMGVSGDIAGKVGKLLNDMSRNMQLIAITHLPQIAGKASDHLRVYKKSAGDRTVSGVERLSDGERVEEIAIMLSDQEVSTAAKETARELLGKSNDSPAEQRK